MKNLVDRLPSAMAPIFVELVAKNDYQLLETVLNEEVPSREERERIEMMFGEDYALCLDENSDPTDRGKAINDVIALFLSTWPIECP